MTHAAIYDTYNARTRCARVPPMGRAFVPMPALWTSKENHQAFNYVAEVRKGGKPAPLFPFFF
jgi:hypothetical protein